MDYNFINEALDIDVIQECVHDTSIGYEADFSENGDVDGWDSYTGIHTYGSWNGFLFGTLYGASGRIGRSSTFIPVACETHYTLRISMKINPTTGSTPTTGRVMWRTLSYPSWDSDRTYDFTIYPDNVWHTYNLNMGNAQWWQGDVNDLRIYPVIDGADEDEFFIREIKITSVATFACNNPTCSYYSSYTHGCGGVGRRAYCLAQPKESNYFDIINDVNDELTVNINGYGDEIITLSSGINIPGDILAKDISKKLSKIDVGGYSENKVTYSELGRFKIYSGTATNDSTTSISDSSAAETLGFFSSGVNVSTEITGVEPADGYKPKSSFKIKSFQLLELFDSSEKSYVEFNPYIYNVEGGRRDWVRNGLGSAQYITQPDVGDGEQQVTYGVIDNEGKTIIDFNHPFNASGNIKKIYMIGSMVDPDGNVRTGCKLKIFRRRKNGTLKTIHTISVPNRTGGKLYSKTQEYVAIDCDLWVNKGDLIGTYNIDVYVGKSYNEDVDALYFQVSGNPTGTFDPGVVLGDGNAGLFFYSRSEDRQQKLVISVDFGKRINIEDITIKGESESEILEYNVARCLDVDWQVDFFGGTHDTGYWDSWNSQWENFNHPNTAYGLSNLTDGIYGNENGEAADSYTASDANGVIPTNPHYFWVNGDEEWVGVHFHTGQYKSDAYVRNFEDDPIALTLHFPLHKSKTIFKSAIYFKERKNFRNFALSYYLGPDGFTGNADDIRYMLIPEFTAITVDNLRYYDGMEFYDRVDDYIFQNPCNSKPIIVDSYVTNYDEWQAAEILDWNVIEHEWSPVECEGFRIYTNYHLSTKINELELYCYVENEGTNVADSTSIKFSQYEELWTDAVVTTNTDYNAEAFIGNTPQYFTIEIEPLTTIKLSDIAFSVDTTDLYVGDKGCRYTLLLDHSKIAASNQAKKLDFKNIYSKTFDLYVDIPQDQTYEEGLTFWSKMDDEESLSKPEVGPGAYYSKRADYPLVFRDKNCAINCPCYGLKNLVDGKPYYFALTGVSWDSYGTMASGISVDKSNVASLRQTVLNLPLLYREKYWKIGFLCEDQNLDIKEMRVLYQDVEYDYEPYYDKNQTFEDGPISGPAPHLNNGSLTGSYYTLEHENYIGFELDGMEAVDQIVLYHNSGGVSCGVDTYTKLYIQGNDISGSTDFVDYSYMEHTINTVGSGTHISSDSYFGIGSVRFDGAGHFSIPYSTDWDMDLQYYTIDFFMKFKSLPSLNEDAVIIKNWDGSIPTSNQSNSNDSWAWAFILRNDGGTYKWQWWRNRKYFSQWYAELAFGGNWTPNIDQWYNFCICRGAGNSIYNFCIFRDASLIGGSSGGENDAEVAPGTEPLVIGENFDGLIDDFRISRGSARASYGTGGWTVPTKEYERSYTMCIYTSPDNINFSKYCDLDLVYEGLVDVYGSPDNKWQTTFYSYFAVDLGRRHDLQIVRNYGGSDLLSCSLTSNTAYSADDISDINNVSFTGTYNDARWVRFRLLSGDGNSRYIRKLGMYPDLTNYVAPAGGEYNHSWNSLGTSVTNYSIGRNVALGATVSGSSTFGELYLGKITDGMVGDTITEAWGSDSNSTQWVEVCFSGAQEIYRVKVFHGYDDSDTDYMIEDYTIQTSLNGVYTTQFTITGNTDFEREHVLAAPVMADSVKMNITNFNSLPKYLPRGGEYSYDWFEGAVLREIEVNEYYGFTNISSEEYPVIAINLVEQFPVVGHELIGIDPEDTSTDWSNVESNFAYSDSVLDEPEKISFGSWGVGLGDYTRWVAIKRNTATELSNGPDYLKHAKMINSSYPYPVKYPWWWVSILSTLSEDHLNTIVSTRSLKIEYPASSSEEHIYLMEGDTFGTDSHAAWRDAFTFWWYIDDINNIDDTYGYVYFGDANSADNVEYRWYLSSLLENLSAGWNNMFLRFKSADEVLYEEDNDKDAPDPRIMSNLETKSIGIRFRGIGNTITMNIDGFDIERNRFMDYSKFHQGFYITGEDYLYTPLADFTLKKGTIEFWLRPDYNPIGVDYFNQFKYRSLFHFTNVANDVFGALIGLDGTIVYYGNIGEEVSTLNFETPYWDIDDLFHLGFVFSNDGSHIDSDNSTIRLYFNGELAGKTTDTWEVGDSKKYNFFIGGKNIHAVKEAFPSGSIDAVISNFKIYNYCKTDFSDSIGNYEVAKAELVKPNEMIEISKDNITFYSIGSTSLPLVYNSVPNNNTVSTYIRSIVPDGLTGAEKRTASIMASWHVTI